MSNIKIDRQLMKPHGIDGMSSRLIEIDKLVREKRAALLKLRHELSRLEGELDGLLAARRVLSDDESLDPAPLFSGADLSPKRRDKELATLSAEWRTILVELFLRRSPLPVSIDEAMSFIAMHGWAITRNAVRSQLHLYANRGLLRRVGEGLYKATDAIKPLCE